MRFPCWKPSAMLCRSTRTTRFPREPFTPGRPRRYPGFASSCSMRQLKPGSCQKKGKKKKKKNNKSKENKKKKKKSSPLSTISYLVFLLPPSAPRPSLFESSDPFLPDSFQRPRRFPPGRDFQTSSRPPVRRTGISISLYGLDLRRLSPQSISMDRTTTPSSVERSCVRQWVHCMLFPRVENAPDAIPFPLLAAVVPFCRSLPSPRTLRYNGYLHAGGNLKRKARPINLGLSDGNAHDRDANERRHGCRNPARSNARCPVKDTLHLLDATFFQPVRHRERIYLRIKSVSPAGLPTKPGTHLRKCVVVGIPSLSPGVCSI